MALKCQIYMKFENPILCCQCWFSFQLTNGRTWASLLFWKSILAINFSTILCFQICLFRKHDLLHTYKESPSECNNHLNFMNIKLNPREWPSICCNHDFCWSIVLAVQTSITAHFWWFLPTWILLGTSWAELTWCISHHKT